VTEKALAMSLGFLVLIYVSILQDGRKLIGSFMLLIWNGLSDFWA
jgi:hypothetical protein